MASNRVEEIRHVVNSLESEATGWLQKLVRIPSITGGETAVQECFSRFLHQLGLEVDQWNPTRAALADHPAFCEDGLPLGERPVLVGRWKGTDRMAPSLILNGHVDVVPVGEELEWRDGPWSGSVRDGHLYGRGSCDMKGGLVSALLAVAAMQRMGIRPRGDLLIESVIGEETGGVGTLATILRGYHADAAIVLEPTRMEICPVGAGAASFRLLVRGKAAHGAMRLEGVSAIEKFYLIYSTLLNLERSRHSKFQHPLYQTGELVAPISVGKIQAGDWPSTVAESLIAEGRFGIFPGEKIADARREFEDAVFQASEKDGWLREHPPVVEWFEGQFESAETALDSRIVSLVKKKHAALLGQEPLVRGVTYGSDLRFYTNYARMPAVLYGPGDVSLAHSMNECVSLKEVMQVACVLALIMMEW